MRRPVPLHRPAWTRPLGLIPVLLLLTSASAATPRSLTAIVQRVTDGKTLEAVAENGTRLHIALLGIDAPDTANGTRRGQALGEEARAYLDHLIRDQEVRVETYGPDRGTRVRAIIWNGPLNVNVLMVAMGYAKVSRKGPCQVYCRDLRLAELRARRDHRGMWALARQDESPATRRPSAGLARHTEGPEKR